MGRFLASLSRFSSDQSGAFLALFGIMALVLTALAGAVVDYTRMEERRNRAQIALDSAALALQPAIYDRTPDQIRADAERLVMERAGEGLARVWVDDVEVNTEAGSLTLSGGVDIPMMFVRLVGVEHLTASIASQATQKKLRLEVALVLDNSGSMSDFNRMYHLKQAATNAVNILFDGESVHSDVFIGLVPYNYHVNVGTDQADPFWWIDRGESRISGDNFQFDSETRLRIANGSLTTPNNYDPSRSVSVQNQYVDRLWIYQQINNQNWRGCVEARPYPLDVRDVPPARSLSDLDDPSVLPAGLDVQDTLFVPMFAPDIPSRWGTGNNGTYLQVANDNGGICTGLTRYSDGRNDREHQERICKYINANLTTGAQRGPNADCGRPILPLNNTRSTIENGIEAMAADGGTNIHLGAMWGWHLLSPYEPFPAADYEDEDVSKVMILMTDGENTPYPLNNMNGAWFYPAYGHPVNNQRSQTEYEDRANGIVRMGKRGWSEAQLKAEMDRRLEMVCSNAKAEGIRIYSIGLSVSAQSDRDMLARCATNPQYAYFTNNPADLDEVFVSIADQLSALRLSL